MPIAQRVAYTFFFFSFSAYTASCLIVLIFDMYVYVHVYDIFKMVCSVSVDITNTIHNAMLMAVPLPQSLFQPHLLYAFTLIIVRQKISMYILLN